MQEIRGVGLKKIWLRDGGCSRLGRRFGYCIKGAVGMGALVDFADKVEKFLEGLCFGSGLIDFRIGSISQFNFEKIAFSRPDISQVSTITWHHCHMRDAEDVAELINKLEGLGIKFSKNEAQNILKSGPVFLEAADKRFFKFSQLSRRDDGRVFQNDIFAITKGDHLVTIVVGDSSPPAIDRVIEEVSSTTTNNSEEIVPDLSEDLASPIALLFRILGSTCYANRDIASVITEGISGFSEQHLTALPSRYLNQEIAVYRGISKVIKDVNKQAKSLLNQLNSSTGDRRLFAETKLKYDPIITLIDYAQTEIESLANQVETRCQQNQSMLLTMIATLVGPPTAAAQIASTFPFSNNVKTTIVVLGGAISVLLFLKLWHRNPSKKVNPSQ